jgi:hypothetical protein
MREKFCITRDKARANQKLENVCVILFFFGFCFVVGPFFMFLSRPIFFLITKNMVITYKLPQRKRLCHNLGFCHSLGEIAKEEKDIDRKEKRCVANVNV